jgi:hypothetical protein
MQFISISFIALIFVCACNANKQTNHIPLIKNDLETVSVPLDSEIDGQYLATFETLNPELSNKISGAFTFSVEKEFDELVIDVRLTNSGKNIIHAQSIRTGSRCPSLIDDKNGDGIIDAIEGEVVYGKVFIPLDGDISTQSSHDGEFPAADSYGNYIYAKVTSFSTFMVDLRDETENQEYIKLKSQEPLSIGSRVVVIHGITEEIDLPATVRTMGPMTIHQSIPLVCGVIQKVIIVPGEIAP